VLPHIGASAASCARPDRYGSSGKPDIATASLTTPLPGCCSRHSNSTGRAGRARLVAHSHSTAQRVTLNAPRSGFHGAIIRPLSWEDSRHPPDRRDEALRTPGSARGWPRGEVVLASMNTLTRSATQTWRLPPSLADPREPPALLEWTRSIPFDASRRRRASTRAYGEWLAGSDDVPKLLLTFEGAVRWSRDDRMVRSTHRQFEIENCGPAGHQAPHINPRRSPPRSQPGAPSPTALKLSARSLRFDPLRCLGPPGDYGGLAHITTDRDMTPAPSAPPVAEEGPSFRRSPAPRWSAAFPPPAPHRSRR